MKTTSPSSTAATITGYAFPTYPARPVNGGPDNQCLNVQTTLNI